MVRVPEPKKWEITQALIIAAMRVAEGENNIGLAIPQGRAGDRAYCVFQNETGGVGWSPPKFDKTLFLLFLAEKVNRP